jgi:uncharacterized RDD family membrane protein YckC
MDYIIYTPVYASFLRRLAACLIDGIILLVPSFFLTSFLTFSGCLVVWFLYSAVLESSHLQGTVGKYVMGIKVLDVEGNQLAFKAAFIRNFIKYYIFFISFIFMFINERKQSLHDLACSSVVIKSDSDV